jgi:non-specific serine/threonine protein kinase
MLARVLKSAQSSAPSSPAKSKEQYTTSSMANSTASHGGVPPSPSKIPRATKESATSKENAAPGAAGAGANGDRSSYLSFLWNQNNQNHNNNQDKGAGAHVSHGTPAAPQGYDEDVHMMTVKGTIAPGALKGAVAVPPVPPMPPMPAGAHNYHYQKSNQPHLAAPGAAAARYDEDVRMRTAKPEAETQVPQRGLSLWEREHLDSPEVRRKATVAQICEFV